MTEKDEAVLLLYVILRRLNGSLPENRPTFGRMKAWLDEIAGYPPGHPDTIPHLREMVNEVNAWKLTADALDRARVTATRRSSDSGANPRR